MSVSARAVPDRTSNDATSDDATSDDAAAPSPREARLAVAAALAAAPPALPLPAGVVRHVEGEVLRPSRHRPVVRWIVTEASPAGTRRYPVIGKVFGRGGGVEAYQLLCRLWAAGFDGRHAVPRPLGYESERSLLLQSEAPPRTLHDGLGDLSASLPDVRRVGAWLAAFHATPDLGLAELEPDFEPRKVSSYTAALATHRPELAARLGEVEVAVLRGLPGAGDAPLVATHGDFQPKNIHLDSSTVVVIDFDRAALAPAARDLGHFVGQSLTMSAARAGRFEPAARRWTDALLDGYLAAGGSREAVDGTPAYVARTFLEVLFYRLLVRPVADTSFAEGWLDECEGWLRLRSSSVA